MRKNENDCRRKQREYTLSKRSKHPFKDVMGYVFNHRLVYENYLSILFDEEVFIPRDWDIHHIIPVKNGGTNALVNLELLKHGSHSAITQTGNKYCVGRHHSEETKRKISETEKRTKSISINTKLSSALL